MWMYNYREHFSPTIWIYQITDIMLCYVCALVELGAKKWSLTLCSKRFIDQSRDSYKKSSQFPGKYLIMKDPNKPLIRLYDIPDNTFESDASEESGDEQADTPFAPLYSYGNTKRI